MVLNRVDSPELHEEILRAIKRGGILIACPPHPGTDPDAVATCALQYLFIRETQKSLLPFMRNTATLFCPTPIFPSENPLYEFLPISKFTTWFPEIPPTFVLVNDYGDFKRSGIDPSRLSRDCKIIGFDHHSRPANDFPQNGMQVIGQAASTTVVMYKFLKAHLPNPGPEVRREIALYTFIGIVADTNGLRDLSAAPDTLQIASACMAEDIPWRQILACQPYEVETYDVVSAFRKKFEPELRFLWLIANREEVISWGGKQVIEDALRILENTRDAVIALLQEQPNGSWKVSLRSRSNGDPRWEISVSRIAEKFGGGGHPNKAAVTFRRDSDPEKILKNIREAVEVQRQEHQKQMKEEY